MNLKPDDWLECQRIACKDLANFTRNAWRIIEPVDPYVHNWHMDCLADHLTAVANGELNRVLFNVPPGTSKSTYVSVIFPAFLWGPGGKPGWRFIGAAHEQSLATRDNRRTRKLIESDWFQSLWPINITSDQNEKTNFENDQSGFRQSCPVDSMTGKRGHVVVWDDPHNTKGADSETQRKNTLTTFDETLPTRMVSPEKSAIVVMMQRLNQDDVSGHILERELGYEHVCLPMEFEPERRCYTSVQPSHFASEKVLARHHAPTQRWFKIGDPVRDDERDTIEALPWREVWNQDPRTEEGELLFEARFPKDVVERDKRALGEYAVAGQFQQRPTPRQGGLFRVGMIEIIPERPAGLRLVRAWDFAATTSKESASAAYTAGGLLGQAPDGSFVICDMKRERLSPGGVRTLLKNTATQDGRGVMGSIPQDPGQSGKAQAQQMIAALAGYRYRASPESGDKVTRAEPFASQVEVGNVKMVAGPWNKDLLDEMQLFPAGTYKDQVDALSRAFMELTLRKRGGSSTTAD